MVKIWPDMTQIDQKVQKWSKKVKKYRKNAQKTKIKIFEKIDFFEKKIFEN